MKLLRVCLVLSAFGPIGCRKVPEVGEASPVSAVTAKRVVDLGDFEVTSGRLVASDPGYPIDMEKLPGPTLLATVEKCRIGSWAAKCVVKKFDSEMGEITSELVATAKSAGENSNLSWSQIKGAVGVDSGQAGIWDRIYFRDQKLVPKDIKWTYVVENRTQPGLPDDLWYSWCCELTKAAKEGAATMPFGVVSNSGRGDGGYDLFVGRNDEGEAVAVRIVFIDDEGRG